MPSSLLLTRCCPSCHHCSEFVAHGLTEDEICETLGADGLIYQDVSDLIACGQDLNPAITRFDDSCFTGEERGGQAAAVPGGCAGVRCCAGRV